jgi:hypothetical protein
MHTTGPRKLTFWFESGGTPFLPPPTGIDATWFAVLMAVISVTACRWRRLHYERHRLTDDIEN